MRENGASCQSWPLLACSPLPFCPLGYFLRPCVHSPPAHTDWVCPLCATLYVPWSVLSHAGKPRCQRSHSPEENTGMRGTEVDRASLVWPVPPEAPPLFQRQAHHTPTPRKYLSSASYPQLFYLNPTSPPSPVWHLHDLQFRRWPQMLCVQHPMPWASTCLLVGSPAQRLGVGLSPN